MPTAPALDAPLDALIADIIANTPEFSGLKPRSILPVFIGAHGTVAASVRALSDCAQAVRIGRRDVRIELGLRPPFFRRGDASRRLATLVHELLHLDTKLPGALLDAHRHQHRDHDAHEAHARKLTRPLLSCLDPMRLAPLGHHGAVSMRTWVARPVPQTADRRFNGRDLMPVVFDMNTSKKSRSVWW